MRDDSFARQVMTVLSRHAPGRTSYVDAPHTSTERLAALISRSPRNAGTSSRGDRKSKPARAGPRALRAGLVPIVVLTVWAGVILGALFTGRDVEGGVTSPSTSGPTAGAAGTEPTPDTTSSSAGLSGPIPIGPVATGPADGCLNKLLRPSTSPSAGKVVLTAEVTCPVAPGSRLFLAAEISSTDGESTRSQILHWNIDTTSPAPQSQSVSIAPGYAFLFYLVTFDREALDRLGPKPWDSDSGSVFSSLEHAPIVSNEQFVR